MSRAVPVASRAASGVGTSHDIACSRRHFGQMYRPWIGHIAFRCIVLHQRSDRRSMFIHSSPVRRTSRSWAPSTNQSSNSGAIECRDSAQVKRNSGYPIEPHSGYVLERVSDAVTSEVTFIALRQMVAEAERKSSRNPAAVQTRPRTRILFSGFAESTWREAAFPRTARTCRPRLGASILLRVPPRVFSTQVPPAQFFLTRMRRRFHRRRSDSGIPISSICR